jgi:hypothetical protein
MTHWSGGAGCGGGAVEEQWRRCLHVWKRDEREKGGGGGKNVRGTISAYVRRATVPSDGYMLRTSV